MIQIALSGITMKLTKEARTSRRTWGGNETGHLFKCKIDKRAFDKRALNKVLGQSVDKVLT